MKQPAAREAIKLLRTMTWVLCTVGLLALIFTTVNVTRFATTRNVPLPIAILLDPMIGTALAGVLYVDARLASWGIRPPAWSTTLRWSAGCTAALMNTWESLWPDGQIGWPRRADPAAVLLHLTPALLLIALTETIAAYRRTVTDLLDRIGSADPTDPPEPPAAPAHRSPRTRTDPGDADPEPVNTPPSKNRSATEDVVGAGPGTTPGRGGPHTGDSPPGGKPMPPKPDAGPHGAANADVWPRAVALDRAARAATGSPVSIWRLRTDLHLGPRRARQVREQLLARHSDPGHLPR
ncbi:extensin [Streptomyces sp. AP-93]|uniref:extensin n=1 Tax=Streptomyces sp. AP-93 TaxID=2929048 RepID=UPI001FB035FC|nr:extensin [Streptomyces sp. AP-93]MCJ0875588.1 extensin [Streptomyces sp. AP-93]